ncbi:MAG: hypothetical protein JOZ33_00135 [Acidobacteriaceae bacterium]|nr:hypothetical protein [Acidobacteriaceae bacterium]
MSTQPQCHLEMHWILAGGVLRLVPTGRQPNPFDGNPPEPAFLEIKRQSA